jgi:hypothetical protein
MIPCVDEIHCPDMTLDTRDLGSFDLVNRTFTATDCAVQEGYATTGAHRLLRPGVATPNIGTYDLIIGTPTQHPTLFQWGACHGHWHYIAYMTIRLWTQSGYSQWATLRQQDDPWKTAEDILKEHPELRSEFVSGHKIGFCVINVRSGYESRLPQYYQSSGHSTGCSDMGVNVGWADVYGSGTEGQWVFVDGLAPGNYMLEEEVNADRLFQEIGDWRNNHAAVAVTLS